MWKKGAFLGAVLAAGSFSVAAWGHNLETPSGKVGGLSAVTFQFMQDNDLNTEDTGFLSNISQTQFNSIIDAAYNLYAPMARQRNETLQINRNWTDSTVNANCSRSYGRVTVNMYGGMARRNEVTPEAFALVLCHELGHAYGGKPYIHPETQIAAEGQADYYGSQTCLRAILPYVDDSGLNPDEYVQSRCQRGSNYAVCIRQMQAGQALGSLLAVMQRQQQPDYETPDRSVTSQTLLSYPRTVQCRMDTFHNGILGLARPACWYRG